MQIPIALIAASIEGAILQGSKPILIKRLIADSREVKPGDLFICIQGQHVDGHRFIDEAIKKGASGLLVSRPINSQYCKNVPVIKVNDVAKALKKLVPRFYNFPSRQLKLIGVTGTNGKTSITYMLKAILNAQPKSKKEEHRIGLIGTIHHEIAGTVIPSLNTTPMAWDIQRLLGDMVEAKCSVAIMEVSSHALAEERVADCHFDIGIYTNLTREHLDYHGTMDHYAAAKRRLFSQLAEKTNPKKNKTAVINLDDPYGQRMLKAATGVRLMTYGIDTMSDVMARDITVTPNGTSFQLIANQKKTAINLKLIGRHNIYNALAVIATGLSLGHSLTVIKKGLESIKVIPGRLELIKTSQGFTVLVDYAHTPDALSQALRACQELTKKQLIVVFGCGGDRDKSKRGPMGAVAAKMAHRIIVTSDNPRQEDPETIIDQIVLGIPADIKEQLIQNKKMLIEVDRQKAIQAALKMARAGDLVLIAGKGHETYQILKDKTIAFDDRKIVKKALSARRSK